MNIHELAAILNGREYREFEMTRDEEKAAKADRLVVVFGASDDLIEVRGVEHDEFGFGSVLQVDGRGFLPSFSSLVEDIDSSEHSKKVLRGYFEREANIRTITANWDAEGYSWTYTTNIPHACFDIVEDGERFCRGIVFSLDDLGPPG